MFYKEFLGIYRLKVKFQSVYTSVFLIESENGAILIDCATTSEDVDNCIVPALKEAGYDLTDIKMLVLTHHHDDHSGGKARIRELAPDIKIITEITSLGDGLCTYPLSGHTADSIGVFDERTHTLITGDGLQGAGIGKFRCYTQDPKAYLETIERIRLDKRIQNILFSHEYEPWYKNRATGRAEIENCLLDCTKYVKGEKI